MLLVRLLVPLQPDPVPFDSHVRQLVRLLPWNRTLTHSTRASLTASSPADYCLGSLLDTWEHCFVLHFLRIHPRSRTVAPAMTSSGSTHNCSGGCLGVTSSEYMQAYSRWWRGMGGNLTDNHREAASQGHGEGI